MRRDFDSRNMKERLTILPVPDLLPEQLAKFTQESLGATVALSFDSAVVLDALRKQEGRRVVAIDIGGDKLASATFQVKNGLLTQDSASSKSFQSTNGSGYLEVLEKIAKDASLDNIPVGISSPGPMEGTRLLEAPITRIFLDELRAKYDCDFANLFPTLKAVANDGVTGMVAGAIEARIQLPKVDQVIYVINGSGLGGGVLKDEEIFAIEPGHIEVVDVLNPLGQDRPCDFFGSQYVCIERIGASKEGIQDIWAKNKGERLDGKQISSMYMQGNKLALDLYGNSALVTAHAIKGIASAFEFFKQPNDTAIVCHGGIFNVSGYGERVRQILQKNLGYQPPMLFTKDFSQNACLEGAAIATLTTV